MTTPQIICLAAIAALVIINLAGQMNRPRITGDNILKAVTTAVIMAKEEGRFLSIRVSDREVEVFCGSKVVDNTGDGDEPQEGN